MEYDPQHTSNSDNEAKIPSSRGSSSVITKPRYDQRFLFDSDSASTIETMSHIPTTAASKHEHHDDDSMVRSVFSYNSTRDVTRFVTENFGRTFNALNDAYMLPSDEVEWARLDKQHSAFLIALGGLYPCPEVVEAVLDPAGPQPKRILDVGCGTGSWAIEMAQRFPHCAVKGVDLAPVPLDTAAFPPNLDFEIDDVNLGLSHFHDQFDLVHARLIRGGLFDVRATLLELQRCLRPGGLLLFLDSDREFQDENHVKVKLAKVEGDEDVSGVSEDGSWFTRIFWEVTEATRLEKADIEPGSEAFDHGLWDQPLLDPETAVSGSVFLPLSPWPRSSDPSEAQILNYVGVIMRQVCSNLHRSFHPMLRKHGISQEILDNWSVRCQKELDSMNRRYSARFPFAWARRRAGEGLPAPPLPQISTDPAHQPVGGPKRKTRFKEPFFELFHTPEEALAAREKRRSTLGQYPVSAVGKAWTAIQTQP